MKFIDQLIETPQSENMKGFESPFGSYEEMGFRMLKRLDVTENVSLSIQASYGHYCIPRQTLPLNAYSAMELAIFKDGEFTSAEEVIDNALLKERLGQHYEGTVYATVPVGLIEELYQELSTKEDSE